MASILIYYENDFTTQHLTSDTSTLPETNHDPSRHCRPIIFSSVGHVTLTPTPDYLSGLIVSASFIKAFSAIRLANRNVCLSMVLCGILMNVKNCMVSLVIPANLYTVNRNLYTTFRCRFSFEHFNIQKTDR